MKLLSLFLFVLSSAVSAQQRNTRSIYLPPKFVPSCTTCPKGYSDGCNTCQCFGGRPYACTRRWCFWQGIPKCIGPVGCTKDAKVCPDGTVLARDPANGCFFPECPSSCPDCPTGGWFDGCNTCSCVNGLPLCTKRVCSSDQLLPEPLCDKEEEPECCAAPKPSDVDCGRSGCHCCSDGNWKLGNSGPTLTTKEVCSRFELQPSKPCKSACCAKPKPSDVECGRSGCHCCSDGNWMLGNSGPTVTSDVACGYSDLAPSKPCTIISYCTDDVERCPDGSYVSRDPLNNCQFEPCRGTPYLLQAQVASP